MYAPVARLTSPPPVKYSDLAAKVTGRSTISGRKIESMSDRWFDARIAPPDAGTFSIPVTFGRHSRRRIGPATSRDS
jgi:hypothetical protein